MPVHKGRPPTRTVTIDCSSIAFHENPTPMCPHGLFWWESDGERLTDDLQAKMCRDPGCTSNEYHPHDGETVTLLDERTFLGRKPLRDLYADALSGALGADFEDRLRDLIQQWVVAWTWTGIDGAALPLPGKDWAAVGANIEYAELLWIIEAALRGKDPREALYRPLDVAPGRSLANG
jgi:hypothetical protein